MKQTFIDYLQDYNLFLPRSEIKFLYMISESSKDLGLLPQLSFEVPTYDITYIHKSGTSGTNVHGQIER